MSINFVPNAANSAIYIECNAGQLSAMGPIYLPL
jgi:hypothetical protein